MNLLSSGSVTIPLDFVGHHTFWPQTGSQPTVPIGNLRTYGYYIAGFNWYSVEQSAGVYTWTAMDAAITAWRTAGYTVTWALRGTPAFYTSNVVLDSSGHAGGWAYPDLDTNLTATKAFVAAVFNRYNAAGGTWRLANPTLGKGIQYATPCNEPQFSGSTSYWYGTPTQTTDFGQAFYTTIKGIDSTVQIGSPSFNGEVYANTFMPAYGTIYPAVQGFQTFDYIDFHSYWENSYGCIYGGMYGDITGSISQYQAISKRYAGNKPVVISEYGFNAITGDLGLVSLEAEAAQLRFTILLRILSISAAMGVPRVDCFHYNSLLCGNWSTDTNGVIAAYNVMAGLVGKTIISATAVIGGVVTLNFSDGTKILI